MKISRMHFLIMPSGMTTKLLDGRLLKPVSRLPFQEGMRNFGVLCVSNMKHKLKQFL